MIIFINEFLSILVDCGFHVGVLTKLELVKDFIPIIAFLDIVISILDKEHELGICKGILNGEVFVILGLIKKSVLYKVES